MEGVEGRSSIGVEDILYSFKNIKACMTEHKFMKLCVTTCSSLVHETRNKEPRSNSKRSAHVLYCFVQFTSLWGSTYSPVLPEGLDCCTPNLLSLLFYGFRVTGYRDLIEWSIGSVMRSLLCISQCDKSECLGLLTWVPPYNAVSSLTQIFGYVMTPQWTY